MTAQAIDLLGVGSPIVDTLARVDEAFVRQLEGGKGGMVLVDAATMHELLGKLPADQSVAPGGSAGNTAYAAGKLGLNIGFLGKLGNDDAGNFFKQRYAELGGDVSRFKTGTVPNGLCVSLVTPDSQRTMRTDLGAAMTLAPDEVTPADFANCRHAHIEGYLLFNRDLMRRVLDCAKEAGCTVSLDLASYEVVQAAADILGDWLKEGIDIVFANEDEAGAFCPELKGDYEALARRLGDYVNIAAVKMGKDGSWISQDGKLTRIEPVVAEAIDTTGAGDYWAGGFLYGWLKGKDLATCGYYGSLLGAEVVQVMGAMLAEDRWQALGQQM